MKEIVNNDFYSAGTEGEIALIEIRHRVLEMITDLQLSHQLMELIEHADKDSDIKALIFYNGPESLNEASYDEYINRILLQNESRENCEPPCFCERNIRFREINILNSLIRRISNMQKIVISGMQGEVVTPFIGAALVADLRYAARGTVLSMIHNRYGLHPSGGLPFFLSGILNHSKAIELQLTERFTAEDACDLGLLTGVLPGENFANELITAARKFTVAKYCTIRDTKRLTNFSRKMLNDYFDYEASLLNL